MSAVTLISLAFATLMVAGALFDIRDRKIPNRLTLAGIAAGLVLALGPGGVGIVAALLGAGLGFLVALPLFALGAFGGGDAKLITAVGAFMGPAGLLNALLGTALIGGGMAVYTTWRCGMLGRTIFNTGQLVLSLLTAGHHGQRLTIRSEGAVNIPYGVAIAAGSLIAWILL